VIFPERKVLPSLLLTLFQSAPMLSMSPPKT
jgi:hypothetical protein